MIIIFAVLIDQLIDYPINRASLSAYIYDRMTDTVISDRTALLWMSYFCINMYL